MNYCGEVRALTIKLAPRLPRIVLMHIWSILAFLKLYIALWSGVIT